MYLAKVSIPFNYYGQVIVDYYGQVIVEVSLH